MLKSNSKKAKENLKNYIMQYTNDIASEYGYNENLLKDYTTRCYYIYKIFMVEKQQKLFPHYSIFQEWAQGLALGHLFCYWYNRSAKKDVAMILEESEKEQEKFAESQAEVFLTKLIYNAILTGYNKFMSKTR